MGESSKGAAMFMDLKVDKTLLDPAFEGYKLSLDPIPVKSLKISNEGICSLQTSESQWSLKHMQLFSSHNHLHSDPWNSSDPNLNTLYFFRRDGALCAANFGGSKNTVSSWNGVEVVTKLAFPEDSENRGDRCNPSLSFPSPSLALVSDGFGKIILFHTGDRTQFDTQWKVAYEEGAISDSGVSFVVRDSVKGKEEGPCEKIECLLERVADTQSSHKEDPTSSGQRPSFVTLIEWITLEKRDSTWVNVRQRRLESWGHLFYAALSKNGDRISCISSRKVTFVSDSAKEIKPLKPAEGSGKKKEYSWGQTEDSVCAVFSVEPGVRKEDVVWRLTQDHITLHLDDRQLLNGDLGGVVDLDGSTWTVADQRLEVTLLKKEGCGPRMWTEVIKGDERGEFVPDPDLVKEASDRLRPFTADSESSNPESKKPAYNSQELEECDDAEDTCFLLCMDGESHARTHEADLGGHQFLFSTLLNFGEMPSICLRYDVDGILWTDHESSAKWTHHSTFNAFGYVQASKQQRKYCTCAPDSSYATVVECSRHAYVYWQPSAVETDLRNRKSGKQVSKVAKQQLVTLSSTDEIVGVKAFEKVLMVLTTNELYAAVLLEN